MVDNEKQNLIDRIGSATNRQTDHLVGFFRVVSPALFISAALFAFLTQLLLRFMDAYDAYFGTLTSSLSLILVAAATAFKRDALGAVIGIIGLVIGYGYVMNGIDHAAKRASINEQRCERIEREMLSAKPARSDLPEVFTALGCSPRSNLHISSPSRS